MQVSLFTPAREASAKAGLPVTSFKIDYRLLRIRAGIACIQTGTKQGPKPDQTGTKSVQIRVWSLFGPVLNPVCYEARSNQGRINIGSNRYIILTNTGKGLREKHP